MYEVQMKHIDGMNMDFISFTCEKYDIDSSGYKFENIIMDNFILNDFEVSTENIGIIKIK